MFILRRTYSSGWECQGERCLQATICQTAVVGGTRGWSQLVGSKLVVKVETRLAGDTPVHHLSTTPLQMLLDKYDSVFQEGLGTLKDFKARIYVDPEAKPRYCKARSVPYAMRQMVEDVWLKKAPWSRCSLPHGLHQLYLC